MFSGLHHLWGDLGSVYESMSVSLKMPCSEHTEKKEAPAQRNKGAEEEEEPEGGSCVISESILNLLSPKLNDIFDYELTGCQSKEGNLTHKRIHTKVKGQLNGADSLHHTGSGNLYKLICWSHRGEKFLLMWKWDRFPCQKPV